MAKHRILTLVVLTLVVFSGPLFVAQSSAGPLNSFASSPIPFWDDNSYNIDLTWSSSSQTVTVANGTNYDASIENMTMYFEGADSYSTYTYSSGSGSQGISSGEYVIDTDASNDHEMFGFDEFPTDSRVLMHCIFTPTSMTGTYRYMPLYNFYQKTDLTSNTHWALGFLWHSGGIRLDWNDANGNSPTMTAVDATAPTINHEYDCTLAHSGTSTYLRIYDNTASSLVYSGNTTTLAYDATSLYASFGQYSSGNGDMQGTWDNFSILDDVVYTANYTAELDLEVPIFRQESQNIELYVNSTDLDSEVRLELYDDTTAGGTYCTFNNTHINFPTSDTFTGTDYAFTGGLSRIMFNMDNERHIGTIQVSCANLTITNIWTDYYTISSNNFLRFIDSSFEGSFTLFYLNGDTNYTRIISPPEWTSSGIFDSNIEQHQLGVIANFETTETEHDVTYLLNAQYLQYVRTEFYMYSNFTSAIGSDVGFGWELQICAGNSYIKFEYNWTDDYGHKSSVVLNDGSSFEYNIQNSPAILGYTDICFGKIMFWRTQENQIALMFWSENEDGTNIFSEGYQWLGGELINVQGINETLFVSDTTPSFKDTNISLRYWVDSGATDSLVFEFQYNYFEYEYNADFGVVSPHFSTTWWGGAHDRYTSTNDYANVQYDWWGYAYSDPDNWWDSENRTIDPDDSQAPKPWWENLLDGITQVFDNMGDILSGGISFVFNMAWDGLITTVSVGIQILALIWITVVNAIAPGVGTDIANFVISLPSIFGVVANVIMLFINFIVYIADWITWGLSWMDKYILTDQGLFLIGCAFALGPVMALSGNNFMGKGTGLEGAAAWIALYASIGIKVLSFCYNLLMGIINTVANFIPLT